MIALPLLVTTLALAPTGGSSRVELAAGANFNSGTVSLPGASSVDDGVALGGGGGVGFSLFDRRIADDDAPPSLQPYLQAATQLHVDGGAGAFRFSRDAGSLRPGNDSTSGYADVSASGYFERRIYAFAHLGLRYRSDSAGSFNTLSLPLDVGGGVRFGDVRFSFGWGVTPTQDNGDVFKVPFWGGAFAQLYAVAHRRVSVAAEVDVLDGGAGGSGGATVYLARRFAVGASVRGGHGHPSNRPWVYDEAGAALSFEAWTGPRFAIALDYSFGWTRYAYDASTGGPPTEDDLSNLIALSFRFRPR